MNGLRKLSLMAAMLVCTTLAAVAQKPNIHILATGGDYCRNRRFGY